MTQPENMATVANSDGVTKDPAELTPAQVEALDRDGDGAAGGSKPRKPAPPKEAGAVVKKGKPQPTEEELGSKPDTLVVVRITGKGDGEVHDGKGGRYDHGDEVVLPLGVAQKLRGDSGDRNALGYVEILSKA